MTTGNWFVNAVGSIQTSLEPAELLREMLAIEAGLGRKRIAADLPADRSIDLDLLYWGDRVDDDPRVTLPHPEITNRLFVLQPLAEIGPEICHPVNRKTSVEMLQDFMAHEDEAGRESKVQITSWPKTKDEVSG